MSVQSVLAEFNETEEGRYIAVQLGKKVHLSAEGVTLTHCGKELESNAANFRVDPERVSRKDACLHCYPKEK